MTTEEELYSLELQYEELLFKYLDLEKKFKKLAKKNVRPEN